MWLYLKFRLQRQLHRSQRDLKAWWGYVVRYFNRHIRGNWRSLGNVRRFILVWWGLLALVLVSLLGQIKAVQATYQTTRPVSGGTYIEGTIGRVQIINPILTESAASADAARLIFSGLTRYNTRRGIEGDLAESWNISPDGKAYTFKLRPNVKWQDGAPLTAKDVLFTLAAIQNPDTRSPLASSWQGVRAEAENSHTVVFTLPNPYTPFIYSTTVGILPSHLLKRVDAANLRVANFNQQPVGTGPFKLRHFSPGDDEILLDANTSYYRGRPRLEHFSLRTFANYKSLLEAYAKRQLTAISRMETDDPRGASQLANLRQYELTLPDETGLFLHTTSSHLADKAVRQALGRAINRPEVVKKALGGNATELSLPLLPGQIGYATKFLPPAFDQSSASILLDEAGWKLVEGVRQKDGQPLLLRLVTSNTGNYPAVAEQVKQQWSKIGVKTAVTTVDVNTLQQSHIRPRNYDVLLYGINIGADPDVYAYWHSSQANDPGLNLSEYSSTVADKALEGARVTTDPAARANKYGTFLAAWSSDLPAIMLYSPHYTYAAAANARGIVAKELVDPSDRFYGVEGWTVRTKLVSK